jgi:hypothetical protein
MTGPPWAWSWLDSRVCGWALSTDLMTARALQHPRGVPGPPGPWVGRCHLYWLLLLCTGRGEWSEDPSFHANLWAQPASLCSLWHQCLVLTWRLCILSCPRGKAWRHCLMELYDIRSRNFDNSKYLHLFTICLTCSCFSYACCSEAHSLTISWRKSRRCLRCESAEHFSSNRRV